MEDFLKKNGNSCHVIFEVFRLFGVTTLAFLFLFELMNFIALRGLKNPIALSLLKLVIYLVLYVILRDLKVITYLKKLSNRLEDLFEVQERNMGAIVARIDNIY
jgi:uncharacterized membrane protein